MYVKSPSCATLPGLILQQTPSPFRLPRRQPSTRRAGSQFANSPRFLLSQSTPQKKNGNDILDDDDDLPSTAPAISTPLRSVAVSRQPRDAIEDSEDWELPRDRDLRQGRANEIQDDSSEDLHYPPLEPNTPGPLDADYDALFAPVRNSSKRRRLAADEQATLGCHKRLEDEEAFPQSPGTLTDAQRLFDSPIAPNVPRSGNQDFDIHATPRPSARPPGQGLVTPGNTKTPFRSKPKFMLSTKKPPSSQPVYKPETPAASQRISPPERRKPNFVLPKSPSPKKTVDDIPAPFSPSSRALSRRGRPRSGLPAYTPGGMAAEVRSWILETGSKREQAVPQDISGTMRDDTNGIFSQYLIAARVLDTRHGSLSSSGTMVFLEAEKLTESLNDQDYSTLNLMVMGLPRTAPPLWAPEGPIYLRPGDLIGIHRGLTWDLELYGPPSLSMPDGQIPDQSQGNPEDSRNENWLVVMEWDLIEAAS